MSNPPESWLNGGSAIAAKQNAIATHLDGWNIMVVVLKYAAAPNSIYLESTIIIISLLTAAPDRRLGEKSTWKIYRYKLKSIVGKKT